jgi:hypothetical protein
LLAAIYLYIAFSKFKVFDNTKRAWMLLFIGMVLYFMAETTYAILDLAFGYDMNDMFPTLADIFWCLGYIPFIWGLFLLLTGYKQSGLPIGKPWLYAFLASLLVLVSLFVFIFVLQPVIDDTETSLLSKVFYFYYPIADVLVLVPALMLIYITSLFGSGMVTRPWMLQTFGFVLFTMADLLYSYFSWQDIYGSGNYIDIAWNLGYLLIALAALKQAQLVESLNKPQTYDN